jgi:hypothetical protein
MRTQGHGVQRRSRLASGLGAVPILLALLLGCLLAGAGSAAAREGDTQTTLFVGTTRFVADDASSYGTTLGASFGYEVIDDLMWSVLGSYSTTDGTAKANGQHYAITARTGNLQTGATYYFNRTPQSLVIPFIGAGLSVISYDVDYTFPNSQLGKTSGTGPGAYALAGLELWLTRSTTFIAQYQLAAHDVRTQSGDHVMLRSGGLLLSIRIGVRL